VSDFAHPFGLRPISLRFKLDGRPKVTSWGSGLNRPLNLQFWQFRRLWQSGFAALCLYLYSLYIRPCPPMFTHFHPRSPKTPKDQQRVVR
jgi:hypothetical protein